MEERLRWKASCLFGGEDVASYRHERWTKKFAYASKLEAQRWIWNEWCKWFKNNDGASFWEEEYDARRLTKPKREVADEQLPAKLEKLRQFMRGQQDFYWRWKLTLKEEPEARGTCMLPAL